MTQPFPVEVPISFIFGEEALADFESGGDGDGNLVQIGSHCAQAVRLLLAQYRDKPRVKGMICAFTSRLDALEADAVAMWEGMLNLESGEGVWLDLIGDIVREDRDGRSDEDYRRGLKVRVLINRSNGKVEELIEIVRLFLELEDEPSATVHVREVFPATLEVEVTSATTEEPSEVHKRLVQAKAAGISLSSIYSDPGAGFLLGEAANYPEDGSAQGMGYTGDTFGGDLGHVEA